MNKHTEEIIHGQLDIKLRKFTGDELKKNIWKHKNLQV